MRTITLFSHDEIRSMGISVIVERWHVAVGRDSTGKAKRMYHEQFSEDERRQLSKLYTKFYDWVMRKGIPQEAEFTPQQRDLIVRAANFFSQV